MDFSMRDYIKKLFMSEIRGIPRHMADYQIILNAAGWHDKGFLTIEDLEEIQTALNNRNQ